jgi:tetratricopeptide (TPR) repeat protein
MMVAASMMERDLGDRDGAVAMYRAAFDTGHPEVAPHALLLAGVLLERAGDEGGAVDAYQRAADAGPPGRRGNALCQLAGLLARRGDTARAKVLWRQVFRERERSGRARDGAVPAGEPARPRGDLDGLRAAYQAGIARDMRDAPNALVEIGQVLRDRGDLDGCRDAWQQAIEAGYEGADDLREELSPRTEDEEDDEPAELPAGLDPANLAQTGTTVLENGLPPLPGVLTHRMAVPMAYWAAQRLRSCSS